MNSCASGRRAVMVTLAACAVALGTWPGGREPASRMAESGDLGMYEGRALIMEHGRFGFIDATGAKVIPPQWDDAGHFAEGLAPVACDGLWGYINRDGEVVIPLQFLEARPFSHGLAAVRYDCCGEPRLGTAYHGGCWTYLDPAGSALPLMLADLEDFTGEFGAGESEEYESILVGRDGAIAADWEDGVPGSWFFRRIKRGFSVLDVIGGPFSSYCREGRSMDNGVFIPPVYEALSDDQANGWTGWRKSVAGHVVEHLRTDGSVLWTRSITGTIEICSDGTWWSWAAPDGLMTNWSAEGDILLILDPAMDGGRRMDPCRPEAPWRMATWTADGTHRWWFMEPGGSKSADFQWPMPFQEGVALIQNLGRSRRLDVPDGVAVAMEPGTIGPFQYINSTFEVIWEEPPEDDDDP